MLPSQVQVCLLSVLASLENTLFSNNNSCERVLVKGLLIRLMFFMAPVHAEAMLLSEVMQHSCM